jgi:hypothetical protein
MTTGVNTAAFAVASHSAADLFSFLTTATYSSEQGWGLTLRHENRVRGVQEQGPEVELSHNVTSVTLKTSVITEDNNFLVTCEELIGTTEYLTL